MLNWDKDRGRKREREKNYLDRVQAFGFKDPSIWRALCSPFFGRTKGTKSPMHLVSVSSSVLWSQVCFDDFTPRAEDTRALRIEHCGRCCPSKLWLRLIKVIELRGNPHRGKAGRAGGGDKLIRRIHKAPNCLHHLRGCKHKQQKRAEPLNQKSREDTLPSSCEKNGRDQFRVFLIIKRLYSFMFPSLFYSCGLPVSRVWRRSEDACGEAYRKNCSPLIRFLLLKVLEVPKNICVHFTCLNRQNGGQNWLYQKSASGKMQ